MAHNLLRFTIAALVATLAGTCYRRPATAVESVSLVTYDVGARPRAIATGDLDRDGRLDAVVETLGGRDLPLRPLIIKGKTRPADAEAWQPSWRRDNSVF